MPPELLPYLEQSNFYQASLRDLGQRLPADDVALSEWIEQTIRANEPAAVMCVLLAALDAGRKVDAKHMEQGARLLPAPQMLLTIALRLEGDVASHLIWAVKFTVMPLPIMSAALLAIAAWCEEKQRPLPPDFPSAARLLVRVGHKKEADPLHVIFLHGIAALTKDLDLEKVLFTTYVGNAPEQKKTEVRESARTAVEAWLRVARLDVLAEVPEKPKQPSRILARGTTMRRAVARIGRNEPCPCGSGQKYKRCCYEKDQKRLHESTHVAGKTKRELDAAPEPYLTLEDIKGTHTYAIAKWDPLKIKPELRKEYLEHLAGYKLWDRVVEVYSILGFTTEIEKPWKTAVDFAAENGRKDIVEALINIRRKAEPEQNFEIGLLPKLLLAGDDAKEKLRLLNECALAALKSDDPEVLDEFAMHMIGEMTRPLGIFVIRSMIPILPREKATELFEYLLRARDALQLPPDDPFSDVIDKLLLRKNDEDEAPDAGDLRRAKRNLEKKSEEVRHMKEDLARLQRDLTLREKKTTRIENVPHASTPQDESVVKELRQKVDSLKGELNNQHTERNELRRALQEAKEELEQTRKQTPTRESDVQLDEGDMLLPQEPTSNHPVRLIQFPRKFSESLSAIPRHIARSTMSTLGRIAAGEPAAFVGAVRLKACPDVTRQRIGSDYRLLFKLHPETVEIMDIINRRDLEKIIKSLT
jgi:hypothetical protein